MKFTQYGLLLTAATSAWTKGSEPKKPNFVFILTDDQDWHMQSLDYMPLLRRHIINQGTLFDKHYCTVSICCPSRVNIWTGLAAHNSNVTNVVPPYGGYPKFVQQGLNENWLPVWLQELGYNTYYTGKLFNAHDVENYDKPLVNGFNGSDFALDPYTYDYFNSVMTRNGQPPVSYKGQYSPDVVAEKALGFLDDASLHPDPFFLAVAPIAPHSNRVAGNPSFFETPHYADRHAHLFKDYQIPRTENFNPEKASGVSWISKLERLNETAVEYHDEYQRARLRALQSVDEMVEKVVRSLEKKGLLKDTYIIFTSDNGFHISSHRLPPGKECPFETDIHVPLAIRGPGVPSGHTAGVVSSHTDLTPTLLQLAGGSNRISNLDGSPLPLTEQELSSPTSGEHVNVEYWGGAIYEGKYGWTEEGFARNNTYKALRLIGKGYNFLYTVWCTGDKELYDVERDPDQVRNLLHGGQQHKREEFTLFDRPFTQILTRLDALLMVTKSCKAQSCREPWQTLHPDSPVKTLKHALRPKFDEFYAGQPKVSFSSCVPGHIVSEEGPQDVVPHDKWKGRGREERASLEIRSDFVGYDEN